MADISKEDLRKEIAAILKDANLASTSAKKVRQELEEKLSVKLQARKKEIDDLVMEFVSAKKEDDAGDDDEEEEEDEEEDEESENDKKKKRGSTSKKPAPKKAKKDSEEESGSEQSEGDSEEEYSPKPAKTRKLPPKKKKGSESDSDEDWGKKKGGKKGGGGGGGGGKKGSGYTKPLQLSPELAALVGADSMARHEVVKKMWAIIKEKNLYDPKNKQYAICDDALFKVIGTKRFRTFGMMKYLKSHFIS